MSVVEITRLIKFGNSVGVCIPAKMLASVGWNIQDRIAVRYVEGKLILDRVPIEALGRVKAGVVDGK